MNFFNHFTSKFANLETKSIRSSGSKSRFLKGFSPNKNRGPDFPKYRQYGNYINRYH